MNEQPVLVWLVIEQDNALLLARRRSDRPPFAGQRVLPGDVMPDEESASETAARIGRDHLDVNVTEDEFVDTLYLQDGGAPYAVNVFRATYEGRPRYRDSGPYTEVRWVLPSALVAWQGLPRGLPDLLVKLLAPAHGGDSGVAGRPNTAG
jgi:ADP-ribose pyrophosphatase YjhB (NUDIX family)